MTKYIVLALLLLSPVIAWEVYKPVRILVPNWVSGITCVSATLCLDDVTHAEEAQQLYQDALDFVNEQVDRIAKPPRAVFCHTLSCYEAFGFKESAANTMGAAGIVVSPRGWKDYYIRHEMIHYLQAERLGVFRMLNKTEWYREGMAYALSQDPRTDLSERWQEDREQFRLWYQSVGKDGLWQ